MRSSGTCRRQSCWDDIRLARHSRCAGAAAQRWRTRLVVLPLYPQYSGTTTASVFDRVTSHCNAGAGCPELRFIGNYHDEPAYIDAIAASVRDHWRTHERDICTCLFSFHGVPRRYLLAGDPYHCQCLKSARLVAERLGLGRLRGA